MGSFRSREAARRFAERRQREDDARRLKDVVPNLLSLRLELHSHSAESTAATSSYVRHIVVDRAPALFVIPCANSACEHGGHDITFDLMRVLEAGKEHFEGEDRCRGDVGPGTCSHVLHYEGFASYR